jgi:tRNA threonylcarbamoyladenosine biosynthesis protein TsaB
MATILCLETSTEVCSVSIVNNGKVVDCREDLTGQNHSKLLTVFVDDILKANHLSAANFDAVAVSEGPGSYTGLRIGVSAAKGICFGAGIPLIGISPLEAMASEVIENADNYKVDIQPSDFLIPMIDARRLEVYTAVYSSAGKEINPVIAKIIDENSFGDLLPDARLLIFGNGAAKCKPILQSPQFNYVEGVFASSRNMAKLAHHKFIAGNFVDVAYFEPFYLKEFMATVPKNSVLNPPTPFG